MTCVHGEGGGKRQRRALKGCTPWTGDGVGRFWTSLFFPHVALGIPWLSLGFCEAERQQPTNIKTAFKSHGDAGQLRAGKDTLADVCIPPAGCRAGTKQQWRAQVGTETPDDPSLWETSTPLPLVWRRDRSLSPQPPHPSSAG